MFNGLADFLLELVGALDYLGVFILMVIESSFIPFPSEIVIPPAAYLASQGEMNVFVIIAVGTLGSLCGAFVNYFLALYLGKPLVYKLVRTRWAKFLLLSEEKLVGAEKAFREYGSVSTFVGRLIPAIRQLISLPAGFVKMDLFKFSFFTALGAGIWVAFLAGFGYFFGVDQSLPVYSYLKYGLIVVGLMLLMIVVFYFKRSRKNSS